MAEQTVLSPISHQPATLVATIPTEIIIDEYQKEAQMNVASYFKGLAAVSIYQCPQTNYRFYYPDTLAGNDRFYEELQKFDWYYLAWKWDYDQAKKYIADGNSVLDIGCGSGRFLKYLKEQKNCVCKGLEFNDKAIRTALADNLDVSRETIEAFSQNSQHQFDVVCAFQVLEHIAKAGDFLEAAIKCVKPGGKLILCIPNNNPWFFHFLKHHALNMPPHHMNMWNRESLTKLGNYYTLETIAIEEESLSRYRYFAKAKLNFQKEKNGIVKIVAPLLYPLYAAWALLNRKNIKAGNIFAVYRKP